MTQTVIVNPIINSPFEEPKRHYRFTKDGITDEIVPDRRRSEYFIPIARPRGRTPQIALDLWTEDRIRENEFINRVRDRVTLWRRGGHLGITTTTPASWSTGPTPSASTGSSSARSKRSRPPSTSPKSRQSSATTGSPTSCARPTPRRTPISTASPSRWPPAAARPS